MNTDEKIMLAWIAFIVIAVGGSQLYTWFLYIRALAAIGGS